MTTNNLTTPAFIIGSPRSGTTILGNILDCHRHIGEWYEPYYIWLRYFDNTADDIWRLTEKNREKARQYIQREFEVFRKKKKVSLVIDKSPGHAYNVRSIHDIFPDAKWIHILRDGRDTTLSIRKEWKKREQIVKKKDFKNLASVARRALSRQPFWRYKVKTINFELLSGKSLNPARFLNKSKWQGQVGWGPRFAEWKSFRTAHSSLEFNAMQWVKTVEAALAGLDGIPAANRMEIRYETLLADPENTLTSILDFLGYPSTPGFFEAIPGLKTGNTKKWHIEFSPDEIETIKPILTPMLEKTGYLPAHPW